jgi:hypothetical protein
LKDVRSISSLEGESRPGDFRLKSGGVWTSSALTVVGTFRGIGQVEFRIEARGIRLCVVSTVPTPEAIIALGAIGALEVCILAGRIGLGGTVG